MKFFDNIQSFFESIGSYVKDFSYLFLAFLGAFLVLSIVIIIITSFSYECMLTKTIDKINKFLERNPRINDDNLVAFNNLMKARFVPKVLRRQWQQFMLYREHQASYYMSFQHCVENPMRNSAYRQQMTVYKIISYILVALSLVVGTFMAVQSVIVKLVLQDILIIPVSILLCYWLISMVLDLVHNATTGDLFQNYQYFEINIDKAMLTLPEFVDYEVLFSQEEIKRGIPVLFEYLQKRAVQEQQELEKARLKSVDHEKFDFDKAGLDGSLVLDRAMRETENFTSQRKKYLQEIERVNNEMTALENNYKEQVKDYQRQVQTSKETVENLKSQLEQASSTIEINYIKKQIRDEISRQQLAEKDFDITTDKYNQEVKSLKQEIKHYDEETVSAKEALESAMLSEFDSYSIKVYNNLEKIVEEKMQDHIEDYRGQINDLETQLEEKTEELENIYTRYQEALAQVPQEEYNEQPTYEVQEPVKKGKKKDKKKGGKEVVDNYSDVNAQYDYNQPMAEQGDVQYSDEYQAEQPEYSDYDQYGQDNQNYDYSEPTDEAYYNEQYVQDANYDASYSEQNNQDYEMQTEYDNQYVPVDDNGYQQYDEQNYATDDMSDYFGAEQHANQYGYATEDNQSEHIPLADENNTASEEFNYVPLNEENANDNFEYTMMEDENKVNNNEFEYVPLSEETDLSEGENNNDQSMDFADNQTDALSDFTADDFDLYGPSNQGESNFELEDDLFAEFKKEEPAEMPAQNNFVQNEVFSLDDEVEKEEPVEEEQEFDKAEDKLFSLDDEIEKLDEDELPSPDTIKKGPGRPRKIVDEEDIKPKRSVGRPKKVVEEDAVEPIIKRKAGRPRKVTDEGAEKPKRSVGRPKKEVKVEKKPVGRPKKEVANEKRSVGRPKKLVVAEKKPVGRPKKDDTVIVKRVGRPKSTTLTTKSVGRPKKEVNTEKKSVGRPKGSIKSTKKVGRPASSAKRSVGRPKKKQGRGRPRKS